MIRDLRTILDGWEYEPGKISVRKIIGRDGKEKVQTRIDLGVLQIELDGRPDGRRPHGYESVFDYLLAQRQRHVELYGDDEEFVLGPDDCLHLRHEAYLYYQRYLSLFVLEDYRRVVRDTERNLKVIDFCERYAGADEDRRALAGQRSYVTMMHYRSRACLAEQEGRYGDALAEVETGLRKLQAWAEEEAEGEWPTGEARVLMDLRRELFKRMPEDAPARLRWELQQALEREDYERAAELRDRLLAAGETPPKAATGGRRPPVGV